jgi:hypothetical protein
VRPVPSVRLVPPVRLARLAACAVLCLVLAACSSGASHGSSGHASSAKMVRSSAPALPAQPRTGPAAAAAVKAMWQTFFNGAVPIPRRLELLQDGQQFASFVHSQAKTSLGSLVLAASGKVSAVRLQPADHASVTYSILLGGKTVAKNLSGTAVYIAGGWKVAVTTFCALVHDAYGKKSKLIPAACGS